MTNKDKPAFGKTRSVGDTSITEGGLTKLEYFTAKALEGILSNQTVFRSGDDHFQSIADDALKAAEFALGKLDKENQ